MYIGLFSEISCVLDLRSACSLEDKSVCPEHALFWDILKWGVGVIRRRAMGMLSLWGCCRYGDVIVIQWAMGMLSSLSNDFWGYQHLRITRHCCDGDQSKKKSSQCVDFDRAHRFSVPTQGNLCWFKNDFYKRTTIYVCVYVSIYTYIYIYMYV